MPYKYVLSKDAPYSESSKANPENIPNDDWPFNYISTVIQTILSIFLLVNGINSWTILRKIPMVSILCCNQINS